MGQTSLLQYFQPCTGSISWDAEVSLRHGYSLFPRLMLSSKAITQADSRSAVKALYNVLALRDEERSRLLVEQVILAVTYTGAFKVLSKRRRC